MDDVGAHTIQEVLRVGNENEDSLEPKTRDGGQIKRPSVPTSAVLGRTGSYDLSSSSSHTQASRSKWFVGSSNSNMKGLMKRALVENNSGCDQ